ncbi:RNA exonuclease 3 [Physcia stellaris]|nr:RNA exonuclease 3 [Physcia stellaris]
MMHEHMSRLNELVKESDDTSKAALELSPQELIRTALNEEEKAAKKNPSVYANVLKLRIVALKKMEMPAWKAERLKLIESEIGKAIPPKSKDPNPLETGLSSIEEIAILPKLAAKPDGLAKHGYVTTQISEAQIQLARDGVESSNNWETCDRCHTRFQVFPSRRAEDGALTTGGSCTHHPSKARRPPPKDKADKSDRQSLYLCCNEVVGRSAGCTTAPTHVFKVSEAKRLALILPFEATPENDGLEGKRTAVCFDCEMGYTTYGMELIRLTATSWPSGSVLLDTLVRPLGVVLDLNSRYSGVWPDDFTSALPSDTSLPSHTADGERAPLPIASSPAVARSLLFNLISPTMPLIGHALENDLNATRIIHPCIVDTCLLFPHVRGLPMRHGLKHLMKKYLDKDIQINDEGKGHDSAEDARSAGELVRVKIREMVAREGMGKDGKMKQEIGAKRSLSEDGVDAVKRGMGSVGEVLRRV